MKISINDIEVSIVLGYYKSERASEQKATVSIWYEIENLPSYTLESTIDYDLIIEKVHQVCKSQTFILIEDIAHSLVEAIKTFPKALHGGVKFTKTLPKNDPKSNEGKQEASIEHSF